MTTALTCTKPFVKPIVISMNFCNSIFRWNSVLNSSVASIPAAHRSFMARCLFNSSFPNLICRLYIFISKCKICTNKKKLRLLQWKRHTSTGPFFWANTTKNWTIVDWKTNVSVVYLFLLLQSAHIASPYVQKKLVSESMERLLTFIAKLKQKKCISLDEAQVLHGLLRHSYDFFAVDCVRRDRHILQVIRPWRWRIFVIVFVQWQGLSTPCWEAKRGLVQWSVPTPGFSGLC